MSKWRDHAARVIRDVVEANPHLDDVALLCAIDDAYPFGPRKHLPYKMWLEERAKARAAIAARTNPADPLGRPCGACGASIGKQCRRIAEEGVLRAGSYHEARSTPTSGPLFENGAR